MSHLSRLSRLTAFLLSLGVALLVGAPAHAQEETPKDTDSLILPDNPGGLAMRGPGAAAAVASQLERLSAERNAARKAEPPNEALLAALNLQIGVLERFAQFLKLVERDAAEAKGITEEATAAARLEAERESSELDPFAIKVRLRSIGEPGQSIDDARKAIEETITLPLREAQEQSRLADLELEQRKAELAALPEQEKDARDNFAKAAAKIGELEEAVRAAEATAEPSADGGLLRRRFEAWQQEALHQRIRLGTFAGKKARLERQIQLAASRQEAASRRLAKAKQLAGAAASRLESLVAKEKSDAAAQIRNKRKAIEAARLGYVKTRLVEELRNLELRARTGRLVQQAEEIGRRREAQVGLAKEAKDLLERYEPAYAPGAPRSARPSSDEVSRVMRESDEKSEPHAYLREIAELRQDLAELAQEEAAVRKEAAALDATFAARVAEARKAWEASVAAPPPGAPRPGAWENEIVEWERARVDRAELLNDHGALLTEMQADLSVTTAARTELRDLRRRLLLLLRRENLFLRGRSHVSREALAEGVRDLALLPGWIARSSQAVGRYLVASENLARLILLLAVILVQSGVLLLLRRRLQARISARVTGAEPEPEAVRLAVLVALRTACISLILFGAFLAAGLLLPSPLPPGLRGLLLGIGGVLGGFWLARGLSVVLVRGTSPAGRVIAFEIPAARRLHMGVSAVLSVSAALIATDLLLGRLGYPNLAVREIVALSHKIAVGVIVFLLLFRRRPLLSLIPGGDSRLARFLRLLVTALHPVIVLLVPTLLVLEVLRYDILAGLIAGVAVNTVGLAVAGYLLYRGALALAARVLAPTASEEEGGTGQAREEAAQVVRFFLWIGFLLGTGWAILTFSGTSLAEFKIFFSDPLPFQSREAPAPATWWGLFVAVFLLYLTFAGTRYLKLALDVFVRSRTRLDRGLQYTIVTLTGYVLLTGGILLAASQLIDLTSIGYVVAALSFGIGFGLQEIFANFVTGIILLFERSVKVGDLIRVGDTEGVVTRIRIRSTTVLTLDNVFISVPNRDFTTQNLVNLVGSEARMRLHIPVGVSYASSPGLVRKVLLEVAREYGKTMRRPPPDVWFMGFGESSLDFELLVWIADPLERNRIRSDLFFAVHAALGRHGIEIPFPQRDLHLKSAEALRVIRESPPEREAEGEEPSGESDAGEPVGKS